MAKKRGVGRPKVKEPYNVKLGVAINQTIRDALGKYGMTESRAARLLIVAGLLRDKLITKADLPESKR